MEKYGLKNYKLIKNYNFNLNKINIAVGENSSGKSSFLRSLQLLKQSIPFNLTKLHTNLNNGLDYGEYFNLVTEGNAEANIIFEINFNDVLNNTYGDMILKGTKLEYNNNLLKTIHIILNIGSLTIKFSDENKIQEIKLNKFDLLDKINEKIITRTTVENCFPKLIFENDIKDSIAILIEAKLSKVIPFNFASSFKEGFIDFLIEKNFYLNEDLIFISKKNTNKIEKFLENINNIKELKQNELKIMIGTILEEAEKKIRMEFENIIYIGPIRAIGERYYRITEEERDKKYTVINNDVSRKLYNLSLNKGLDEFNNFIKENFDFGVNVVTLKNKNNEDIFFSIEINRMGDKKNLLDVGAGYSQLIPILYTCFGKEKFKATIVIEQPELHLHPKMQSDLIDFILKLSKKNSELKFIIETHSSLMIDRIGKNIFKKNYNPNNVNIFIFEKQDELKIQETKYSNEGILKKWPIRFFSGKEIKEW